MIGARPVPRVAGRAGGMLGRRATTTVQVLVYLLIAAVMLFPLFWMIASSFKTAEQLQALPPVWLPSSLGFEAYERAFSTVPFARSFLNSFVIAGGTTVGIIVTSVMAGYVFAKLRFRGRET